MKLKFVLLAVSAYFFIQSCKREVPLSPKLSENISVEEVKSFFENSILPNSKLTKGVEIQRASLNSIEKLAETNDLLLKRLNWRKGFYQITKNDTAIVIPITFEFKSYFMAGDSLRVNFEKLNFAEFRKDRSGKLTLEWITYYPDVKWLKGDRSKFIGRTIVADWDGNIKRMYLHEKGKKTKKFKGGNVPLSQASTALVSNSDEIGLKNITLPLGRMTVQTFSKNRAKLMSGREYMDIDGNCWRNIREIPAAGGIGVTLVRESIACPTAEEPTDDPDATDNGGGEGSEGGNSSGNGGSSGPAGCNSDPGYTVPLYPPPAGTDWQQPCDDIDEEEPTEGVDTDPTEAESLLDTDCESFVFTKTSTANWQEAGLNNIVLRMIWVNGAKSSMRNIQVNHVVYGLPTFYTNANGTTTPLSPGGAANKAAVATENARNDTYDEFKDAPYFPSNQVIINYFKTKLAEYMEDERGTAGATGSGSDKIIFRDEIRSHWTDPNDC